jgi:hypothetical protein
VSDYSTATQITLDDGVNVIAGGYYIGSVYFSPSSAMTLLATAGGGYIAKLNSSGALLWAKGLEKNGGTTSVTGLDTEAAGDVYAIGYFTVGVDLDPSPDMHWHTLVGSNDGSVAKLKNSGGLVWAEAFGGTGTDVPIGISVDLLGDVHVAKWFFRTTDFNPRPSGPSLLASGPQSQGFL